MTIRDCFDKYEKEICINCKNKNTNLCEIRYTTYGTTIEAKCIYYEKDEAKKR